MRAEIAALADLLGINPIEAMVIEFLATGHDFGRVMIARDQMFGFPSNIGELSHGFMSGIFLTTIDFPKTLPVELVTTAAYIANFHDNIEIIVDEKIDPDFMSLLWLIRDIDKLAGFEKAKLYTTSKKEKTRQADANWPEQRRDNPNWGVECGRIIPATMILDFTCQHSLNRNDCQSYESYILQLLAWIFDIKNPEILQYISDQGYMDVIDVYFKRKLSEVEYSQIHTAYTEFLVSKGVQ